MMISPDGFIYEHKDDSYKELISVRDELIQDIRAFEKKRIPDSAWNIKPSPEVIYQCNLEYLAKVCELISEKYRDQINDECEEHWIFTIRDYLLSHGLTYDTSLPERIRARMTGKEFLFADHVKALIYSMLTNSRKWYYLEPHLTEIDELFFNYDTEKILEKTPEYYCEQLRNIKCGNRDIKAQMESLSENIKTFRKIENEYGSMDSFVTSDNPNVIVKKLSDSNSKYKIKELGPALAWEYIRNVGIDGAKPDIHLRRFLGNSRMGICGHEMATEQEVIEQVVDISEETGLLQAEVDNLIWSFCADGYGEICTASPRCEKCPVRRDCKKIGGI